MLRISITPPAFHAIARSPDDAARLHARIGADRHAFCVVAEVAAMIRISITVEAFEAIVATSPASPVRLEPAITPKGERML